MTATLPTHLSNLAHYWPGDPNGLATLDGSGKVPTTQLPASVLGAMSYQGTWNASTNFPALQNGVGTKGHYYVVNTQGTTSLDGISQWYVGDVAVFNGTDWDRLDGSANEILSVNGKTGVVVLSVSDISGAVSTSSLGSMAYQNSNSVSISGGTINGGTINGVAITSIGTNASNNKFVANYSPTTQGANGDIWYEI